MKIMRKLAAALLAAVLAAALAVPSLAAFNQDTLNGIVMIRTGAPDENGAMNYWRGTGFFVGTPGEDPEYIVTNCHVVEDFILAGKALGGLSGIAVGIERDSGSRAAKAQRLGLGSLGEVGNDDGDTTRGAHRANVAVGETGGVEAVANQVAKLLGRLVQRDSGQLFAAQLDQIITVRHRIHRV